MRQKKPIEAMICGIGAIIIGIIMLFAFDRELQSFTESGLQTTFNYYLLVLFVHGLGFIITGIFVLKLHNWARIVFILLIGLNMFGGLFGLYFLNGGIETPWKRDLLFHAETVLFFSFLPFLVSFHLLSRPKIKSQFK